MRRSLSVVTARPRFRDAPAKPLTEDRKALVRRYMIDATQAKAEETAREAVAAAEHSRRDAAGEAARQVAAAAEQARRDAADEAARQILAAAEQARRDAADEAARPSLAAAEQARAEEAAGLPVFGWLKAATEPNDGSEVTDWARDLLRNKEDTEAG